MRYLTIVLLTSLLSSCAWWPWGSSSTGNCVDDGTCEGSNPFEEQLIGGTWHCYGKDRDEPWDCSQQKDDDKIVSIDEEQIRPLPINSLFGGSPDADQQPTRAELELNSENISSTSSSESGSAIRAEDTPTTMTGINLADFDDSSFAVQLIALQTMDEVKKFANDHNIDQAMWIQIESQGSDWYVVLLGVFDSESAAQQAANTWNDVVKPASRPWVRPIGPLRMAADKARAEA